MDKILDIIINKDSGKRLKDSFTFEKIYFDSIIKNPKSIKDKEDLYLIRDLLKVYDCLLRNSNIFEIELKSNLINKNPYITSYKRFELLSKEQIRLLETKVLNKYSHLVTDTVISDILIRENRKRRTTILASIISSLAIIVAAIIAAIKFSGG